MLLTAKMAIRTRFISLESSAMAFSAGAAVLANSSEARAPTVE